MSTDFPPVGSATTSPVDRHAVINAAFTSHHSELYNFLRRSTRDEAAAEDLLQEVYLRLTREVEAGRIPDHVRGWLYRVAANLATSRARRRTTASEWMSRYGRLTASATAASPEADVMARERSSSLEQAMAALPADARMALLMSAEGFSGQEIADAIGKTNMATRTLLSRARVRVRLMLEQEVADR
ncbi:MAG TPA: sigma-70 family RNA polymerase sigma factor [Candidatus Limnocylindrales bacterium]